jgi:hypothetical protein
MLVTPHVMFVKESFPGISARRGEPEVNSYIDLLTASESAPVGRAASGQAPQHNSTSTTTPRVSHLRRGRAQHGQPRRRCSATESMNQTPTMMAAPMRPRTTTSPSPKLGADLGAHKCYRHPIFVSDTPASTTPTSATFSRGQSCRQPRGLRVSASPSSGTLTDRVWSRRLRCALQGGPSLSRSEPAPGVRATSSPNLHPCTT